MNVKAQTDKELADRIVALGVGEAGLVVQRELYRFLDTDLLWSFDDTADVFVRDWRVAGAGLDAIYKRGYSFLLMQMPDGMPVITIQAPITTGEEYSDPSERNSWASQVVNESLPRAINKAWVDALDA